MKKLLIILISLMFLTLSYSQITPRNYLNTYFGISTINYDCINASNLGLLVGIDYNWFTFYMASNLAQGTGERLNFKSSYTYKHDKIKWTSIGTSFNFQIIPIFKNEDFILISPTISKILISEIYNDPILFDTYYTKQKENNFNVGLDIKYINLSSSLSFIIGFGTIENFRFGIGCHIK